VGTDRFLFRFCLGFLFFAIALTYYERGGACLSPSSPDFERCILDSDFVHHFAAARLFAEGHGAEAYSSPSLAGKMQELGKGGIDPAAFRATVNLPTMMLALRPLAGLPLRTAWFLFILAGATAYFFMAWLWGRWLGVAAAAGFAGVWHTVSSGQNGLLIGGLLGLGLGLMERTPRLAGVLFGLCSIKPQFGLLLPIVFLAGRCWPTFVSAVVTVVVLVLCSLVFPGGAVVWQGYFSEGMANGQGLLVTLDIIPRFASVYGALVQQGVVVRLALWFQLASAVLALAAAVLVWWRTQDIHLRTASVIFATLVSIPLVYDYDLPIAFAGALAFAPLVCQGGPALLALPAIALLYLFPALYYPHGVHWPSVQLLPGSFWILLLLCVRLSRIERFRISR
jgi:hypothetical protein